MKILLKSIVIRNFKGCKELDVPFGDKTTISGMNASGKTTVFDAFTWLLFNKDSLGSSKFDIRPLKDGKMVDNIEISVEAVVFVGKDEYTLKKVQKQKWVKKRGTDTRELQGNVNDFEINGYPKSEKEFKEFISGIIDEKIFGLVTDPVAFNDLPWKEQREILMKFIGVISDVDIASVYGDKFSFIIPELKIASTEDIIKKYDKARKALNKQMDGIPQRIDELTRQIVSVDVGSLEVEKAARQAELKKIEDELSGGNGKLEEIGNMRERVMQLKLDLSDIANKENEAISEKRREFRSQVDKAEDSYREISSKLKSIEFERDSYIRQKEAAESEKDRLTKEWYAEKAKTYPEFVPMEAYTEPAPLSDHDLTCPTCGQALPESVRKERIKNHEERCRKSREEYEASVKAHKENYEKRKADFTRKKNENLERIKNDGIKASQSVRDYQKLVDERNNVIESLKNQLEDAKYAYSSLASHYDQMPRTADLSQNDEYQKIQSEIASLEEQIHEMSKESSGSNGLIARKSVIQSEIEEINAKIASADNTRIKDRIAELEEEQKSIGQKIAEQERMIDLTEEFIRTKMNMISEKINEKFKVVSFKLFDNQINGGLKETCECTVNGVPYASLNNGHRIVAGLDIIRSLSELYGISCPIWIDNAESINEFNVPELDAQMIFLRVTEDKELKFEREDE